MRPEHAAALGFTPPRPGPDDPGRAPLQPREPISERLGHGHRVVWPAHDVSLTVTAIREHADGITAEVAVTRAGDELHWSKVNLSSSRSRAELAKPLLDVARHIPWKPIVERTCRLAVEAARAGNPSVAVIPRRRLGPRFLIDPLAPTGETTVLAGDGGAGKSYLATALVLAISSEAPLPLGLRAEIRGPVLYLDWESTEDEFAERAFYLANGLGCRVRDLHYKPMVAPLAAELAAVQADEALGRAPAEARDRALEGQRARLRDAYQQEVPAIVRQLEALETLHLPEVRRGAALDWGVYAAVLGTGSALLSQVRSETDELLWLLAGRATAGVTVPSVRQQLERLTRKIDQITRVDQPLAHEILAEIARAPEWPDLIRQRLGRVRDLQARLRQAYAIRREEGSAPSATHANPGRRVERPARQIEHTFNVLADEPGA